MTPAQSHPSPCPLPVKARGKQTAPPFTIWASAYSKLRLLLAFFVCWFAFSAVAVEPQWLHLSSATGDLPIPGTSKQQTGALVADLDRDGTNDFVLSFRQVAPALVWYRRTETNWSRYVIEP